MAIPKERLKIKTIREPKVTSFLTKKETKEDKYLIHKFSGTQKIDSFPIENAPDFNKTMEILKDVIDPHYEILYPVNQKQYNNFEDIPVCFTNRISWTVTPNQFNLNEIFGISNSTELNEFRDQIIKTTVALFFNYTNLILLPLKTLEALLKPLTLVLNRVVTVMVEKGHSDIQNLLMACGDFFRIDNSHKLVLENNKVIKLGIGVDDYNNIIPSETWFLYNSYEALLYKTIKDIRMLKSDLVHEFLFGDSLLLLGVSNSVVTDLGDIPKEYITLYRNRIADATAISRTLKEPHSFNMKPDNYMDTDEGNKEHAITEKINKELSRLGLL